ncbi:hypothetical protein [Streptomyces sp. NBC_00038]|uniref:hypothetical protein n=1 Tax=Streptomyces sp. NBC_00038 TaxID=2903615 RepID=UPI00225AE074|nr:hypothetical protein [Streptomyces sp. NBC_00038]MCX5563543.1 hypothetical protein [Streptomyces sp. NBC_00038]
MSPEPFHEPTSRRPLISDSDSDSDSDSGPAFAEPEPQPADTVGRFRASPSRSSDTPASQARGY